MRGGFAYAKARSTLLPERNFTYPTFEPEPTMPPPVIHASMTFAYRGHPYQVELAKNDDVQWSAVCTVDSLTIPIGDNTAQSAA
jgi:hypothetical protein